jgi:transitional endoplasmic reticulum ATPase
MQDRPTDPTLKLLLDALALAPDNAPLRMHVATAMEKAAQPCDALAHFERVACDRALGDDANLGAARCALSLGDLERSLGFVNAVLASVPDHAMALLLRARVHERRSEHREARRDYERAVQLDPELADTKLWDALLPSRDEGTAGDGAAASTGPREGVSFADVGGLDEVKERIRMRIVLPFQKPELFAAFGKKGGGGMLFYGPPGCGKTFLARATAGECGAHFVSVGLHEVLDMWIGNSERQLHAIFEDARRRAPTVLFFDEVDALGMQRAKLVTGAMRGVITQFLAELDGFSSRNEKVLVLGATNTPWDVDSAFRRPGRFSQVLFVPPPDRAGRSQILKLKLGDKPQGPMDFLRLAEVTEGWSGADLENLIDAAAEAAIGKSLASGKIEPITMPMLEAARARLRPSTREWFGTIRNHVQFANESGQYDEAADYMRRHNLM